MGLRTEAAAADLFTGFWLESENCFVRGPGRVGVCFTSAAAWTGSKSPISALRSSCRRSFCRSRRFARWRAAASRRSCTGPAAEVTCCRIRITAGGTARSIHILGQLRHTVFCIEPYRSHPPIIYQYVCADSNTTSTGIAHQRNNSNGTTLESALSGLPMAMWYMNMKWRAEI